MLRTAGWCHWKWSFSVYTTLQALTTPATSVCDEFIQRNFSNTWKMHWQAFLCALTCLSRKAESCSPRKESVPADATKVCKFCNATFVGSPPGKYWCHSHRSYVLVHFSSRVKASKLLNKHWNYIFKTFFMLNEGSSPQKKHWHA